MSIPTTLKDLCHYFQGEIFQSLGTPSLFMEVKVVKGLGKVRRMIAHVTPKGFKNLIEFGREVVKAYY